MYSVTMPVFCTAPASASTVTTGATPFPPPALVTSVGTITFMPSEGKVALVHASIVLRPKFVLETTLRRY